MLRLAHTADLAMTSKERLFQAMPFHPKGWVDSAMTEMKSGLLLVATAWVKVDRMICQGNTPTAGQAADGCDQKWPRWADARGKTVRTYHTQHKRPANA
jgi:hypothetical protein